MELNGSLKVAQVLGPDNKPLEFVQDTVNKLEVRVNLGQLYQAGKDVKLSFRYEGQLATAEGGVLPDKRLSYVGPEGSYLMYAGRWFPFHDYFADRATAEINVTVPKGISVAGYSEVPVTPKDSGKGKVTYSFVNRTPQLIGTLAAAPYITRNVKASDISIDFFVKPGSEGLINPFTEELVQIFSTYNSKFGRYAFGNNFEVAEIDDQSLPSYTMAGITLLSQKFLEPNKEMPIEVLAREVAYQWWGQGVGLKSFDDAWMSQGLAEFSAYYYRQTHSTAAQNADLGRETLEKALAYESQTSIRRAPAELDDQSPAYQSIVFYKGAIVFNMLRNQLGDDKFFALLHDYYNNFKGQKGSIDQFEQLAAKDSGQNMRQFFGEWVDSTGVPEFRTDYNVLRTREGKFIVRGTLRQDLDTFKSPVDVLLESENGEQRTTVYLQGTSADFEVDSKGKPVRVVVDPDSKILRMSDDIRVAVIARRGIEHMRAEEYPEAEQAFRDALKQNPRSSWVQYNLGLLYMTQRNYQKAIDTFGDALDGDLTPTWLEAWSYLKRGNAYDALGQRERAVAEYDKVISNGSNYDNAQQIAEKYKSAPYTRGSTAEKQ
jgi:aminopeptidase N